METSDGRAPHGPEAIQYNRLRIARAREQTKAFWNVHRTWAHFTPSTVGILVFAAELIWHGFTMNLTLIIFPAATLYAILLAVVIYFSGWIGDFLINYIWCAPAALHKEQGDEVSERDTTITALNSIVESLQATLKLPVIPKHQLDARKRVQDLLIGANTNELDVLRFMIDHGESFYDDVHRSNPRGAVDSALEKWRDNLIHVRVEYGTNRTFWSITHGLHEALIYVLHEDSGESR
jgi:hypothetical protein